MTEALPAAASAWESWAWCAPKTIGGAWSFNCVKDERAIIWCVCAGLLVSFLATVVLLVFGNIAAPYGRYNQASEKAGQGFVMRQLSKVDVPVKVAWVVQECPTLIAAAACWAAGAPECLGSAGNRLALFCFTAHYFNRTIIYPMLLKGSKPIPLSVMLMAFMFCAMNGYIQCRTLTRYVVIELDAQCIAGSLVWIAGLCINIDSDHRLRNLRKPGETGYKIPSGGMFEYVSGANFLGEIIEWIGYAVVMKGAMAGATFAFCTACNIGPRALAHHAWYKTKFENYPKHRAALVPFWPFG